MIKGVEYMYHHFILLHSDYHGGRRVAYHQIDTSIKSLESFFTSVRKLNEKFPHLSFGFHHLQTESNKWKSVMDYDSFFKDVFPVNEIEDFGRLISTDEQVSALDVANLITSKINCTHLKLQKLLYFFYTDYIRKHKVKPFSEDFLAWDYGPVVREVYDAYKSYGRSNIHSKEDDITLIMKERDFKLSVYSRFKKTSIHGNVLETLEETLNEYGDKSATELVNLTHQKDSPWDKVFKGGSGRNSVIQIV